MKTILDLSTRAKLLLGFGLLIALLATVSTIAYRDTAHLKESQRELFQEDLSISLELMALRTTLNRERVALLSLVIGDAEEQARQRLKLEQEGAAFEALIKKLSAHKLKDTVFAQKLDKLVGLRRHLIEDRNREVFPAVKAGKRDQAASIILGPLQQSFQSFRELADQMGEEQIVEAEKRMRESEILVDTAQTTLIVANLVAIVLGLALVLWLDRLIAMPLKQATAVAQRIAGGDLTVSVPTSGGKDEVGQLLGALDTMVDNWKQTLKEISGGIVTLSAAASEILASTMQASAGATETAAAVSETTATVEEVKQTALLASQKARTVSDAAQRAVQTADAGRKAVEGGMEGMENIQEQMESIAETIVRLSERSQAIAEIIATVGGLAEQSNLLAVNAAIEAAKAGEQGKGFAVVAQEVKDLADQSKQATRQVRVILSDIQKAISAAVMTTEQGSRTVAGGVEQTTEAGNAIRSLAQSISDAAQAAAQIAASSQQQLAGMDQVAMAMENIKQASAENAAGARQSDASAQHLHELGQKLKQVSERFKF
ncbi:methyl-accepting chemotaxis protein [Noviherbaspirillum sp.]|uniref:methyl-accepting chemotaxis protein n=1 Tax=Noviherbaspirillum sp. TaxID=1926288 RepID=UPI002B46AACF|nr:methyl-accepting chemotaxis protein [Noviherbaspirillum sp.]HJV80125.1 methyl-accepting chemotaxis protein [Noviherbaspirillum sp.]